ncbi:hypothetical protein GDO81_019350 [Engystomops pustulosus]|uniref:RNA-binding protein 48 n=1 Tax=Engystomops pustulosus TaxID=76066 RepID=A0AAV6YZF8_ENGPU|nr:hypothetical protein GDO81_019350 [Engystomops pustulosus]
MKELVEQFALYGAIEEYNPLDDYPAEQFTEVYLIKFQRLQSARIAKRKLDECSFFGGVLHVCYAPEFESVQETREKLQDRRRYVARATAEKDGQNTEKRKAAAEKSSPAAAPVVTNLPGPWGPAPQPRDFSPMPPLLPAVPYQQYTSAPPSGSYAGGSAHPPPCARPKGILSPAPDIAGHSTARFMPRTTQLQERQRRREESLVHSLSLSDSPEVVIGPKLPEPPKLDLEDDSLNTSVQLIRGKLKQVSESCTATKPETTEPNPQAAPPVKQRRRI